MLYCELVIRFAAANIVRERCGEEIGEFVAALGQCGSGTLGWPPSSVETAPSRRFCCHGVGVSKGSESAEWSRVHLTASERIFVAVTVLALTYYDFRVGLPVVSEMPAKLL